MTADLAPTGADTTDTTARSMSIAVMGASGYVGRRLVAHLAREGHHVTAIGQLTGDLPSGPGIEPRPVDVGDPDATAVAVAGADSAYYLVHAMAAGEGSATHNGPWPDRSAWPLGEPA